MNTQVLQYLIAISEEHSLTRAAERFYLSQPSLSHHLANAERELGVKLFRKEGRALWPTEEGVIFVNNARAILHTEAQALKKIEELRRKSWPGLRLCAAAAEMPWLQRQVLPGLGQSPQIQLVCTELPADQGLEALAAGSQDLTVWVAGDPPPQGPWTSETLWQDQMVLAVPAAWRDRPLPPDLGTLCYLHCRTAAALAPWAEHSLARAGISPGLACTAPDLATTVRMVAAGHGCAFLPQGLLEQGEQPIAVCRAVPAWSARRVVCYRTPEEENGAAAMAVLLEALRQSSRLTAGL